MKLKMEQSSSDSSNSGKSKQPITMTTSSTNTTSTTTASAQQQPQAQSQNGGSNGATTTASKSSSAVTTTIQQTQPPSSTRTKSSSSAMSSTSALQSTSSPWSPSFRLGSNPFPLRILVLKDLVGAIIGRSGGTIKQITQETHAKVDVLRKESSAANENVIVILGSPESCSQACRRILEVMQQEARSLNRPDEISLKILASNNLIGRIIGKGGQTIKRIMQQTDTKITISSANLASSHYHMERVISILGQLENMCKAEVLISQKLRQCYESDYIQYQHSLMYSVGYHSPIPPLLPSTATGLSSGPLGLTSTYGGPHGSAQAPPPPPLNISYQSMGGSPTSLPPSLIGHRPSQAILAAASSSVSSPTSSSGPGGQPIPLHGQTSGTLYNPYNMAFMYPTHHHGPPSATGLPAFGSSAPPPMSIGYQMLPSLDNIKETVTVYIPNSVVGAVIGRGGSTIREMMISSGANIKVAQPSDEESTTSSSDSNKPLERRVTIFGNQFSQSQAQFFVFQKVFTELSNQLSASLSTSSGANILSICPYGDPAVLKIEILVPSSQVRRIIGKGGSVITELQRSSGATIKLSKETTTTTAQSTTVSVSSTTVAKAEPVSSVNGAETTTTQSEKQPTISSVEASSSTTTSGDEMTSVSIIGDFYASFNAQRQIRSIVHRSVPSLSSSATATAASGSFTGGGMGSSQFLQPLSGCSKQQQSGSSSKTSSSSIITTKSGDFSDSQSKSSLSSSSKTSSATSTTATVSSTNTASSVTTTTTTSKAPSSS